MNSLNITDILKNPSIFDEMAQEAQSALDAEKERLRLIPPAEVVFIEAIPVNRLHEADRIIPAEPGPYVEGDIMHILKANADETKWNDMRMRFIAAFEDRIRFEAAKENCADQMIDNLINAKNEFTTDRVCHGFVALGLDETFVNRASSKASRFNVYALLKVVEIAKAMSGVHIHTSVVRCFLKSLLACRAAEVPFTQQLQLAALSRDIRIPKALDAHLTRHGLSKATAAAQRSQMVVALEALDLLASNGLTGAKNVITLKDTPAARQLVQMVD